MTYKCIKDLYNLLLEVLGLSKLVNEFEIRYFINAEDYRTPPQLITLLSGCIKLQPP